jgi:predicted nucleotidyltransferase
MAKRQEILDFLIERKEELCSEFHLIKIGLFGSFAQNKNTNKSDIDLLIEFLPKTENIHEKKLKIKELFSNKFGLEVDICREKYIKPYFRNQILQTVIYV